MVRYRRVHLDAAGGCHLDRSIDRLIRDAGFHIVALENEYLKGPRPMTYTYRASRSFSCGRQPERRSTCLHGT